MQRYILLILLFYSFFDINAQPKREVRAVWLTTAFRLDWPAGTATSPVAVNQQKKELVKILDRLHTANFNTILFQVRMRGDLLYPSSMEPFSAVLSGKAGKGPGYDPLAFVVEECHKRGMECHAWLVTIPLGSKENVAALGAGSIIKKQPAMCVLYKNEWYLNPGHPETKVFLMKIVREIVSGYDVDGVHFDYLRYPDKSPGFPDKHEYQKYGKKKEIGQWRRENITEIVRYLYRGIKGIKPWVKVSSCPVGKYKNTNRFTSRTWNSYYDVNQDAQAWLAEGIHDQLYPMMYFQGNDFYPFALDWKEQSNGRHIVPGLAIYFMHPEHGEWSRNEVERQINFVRTHKLAGHCYYRTQYLMENTQGIYDELAEYYYATPALIPAMPWIDDSAPTSPGKLTIRRNRRDVTLSWSASADNDKYNEPSYIIYGSDTYPVDTSNPANIIAQRVTATTFFHTPIFPWEDCEFYAVTAIDRCGNESEPAQMAVR